MKEACKTADSVADVRKYTFYWHFKKFYVEYRV